MGKIMKAQAHFVSIKDIKHSHEALMTYKHSQSQKKQVFKLSSNFSPLNIWQNSV